LPKLQYFQSSFAARGVLEQHAVHLERVDITVAESIDLAGDVSDEVREFRLVVDGYFLACLSTRWLLGHLLRLEPGVL